MGRCKISLFFHRLEVRENKIALTSGLLGLRGSKAPLTRTAECAEAAECAEEGTQAVREDRGGVTVSCSGHALVLLKVR